MDKMKISKEVYDGLVEWKHESCFEKSHYITPMEFKEIPFVVKSWWLANSASFSENNNRIIAIIKWVNGEDVFEVEKPKKWVVRIKLTDKYNEYGYVALTHDGMQVTNYNLEHATKFDTKEEAESWANAHQEVVEV